MTPPSQLASSASDEKNLCRICAFCSRAASAGRDTSWKKTTSAIGVKLRMCETMAEMRAPGSSDEASTFQVIRVSPESLHLEPESGARSSVRRREAVVLIGVYFSEVASNPCQE